MRILGIESSSLVASVALVEGESLVAEYTTNFKKTHSQTLLPMIDEMMGMVGVTPDTVDAIAVAGGPGSFTGLRIGVATAKGLGLALQKPLIHIPTLDAMAYQFFGSDALICPMMDAKRQQVYTGLYTFDRGFQTLRGSRAMGVEEWLGELAKMPRRSGLRGSRAMGVEEWPGEPAERVRRHERPDGARESAHLWGAGGEKAGHPVGGIAAGCPGEVQGDPVGLMPGRGARIIFLGDGVPVYRDAIEAALGDRAQFAPPHMSRQRAGAVAALGQVYFGEGSTVDGKDFPMVYLRKPQAERERERKANR
ncbi:MAG: tRNA (adenosine(37)-N6)-threonylcarbamoyltransferase complex dimerization subunit type 1 TsaB [Lachnospiraceae bacterium]|nr:tRNA (adenosine(37)-N6)-threonylcarbamoyltransferase complex dimerization subunit type 1 TsaB [Lachnospiraceae bacterium]